MITLITGGSKCGKSSLAESFSENFDGEKIYIATMKPFGEEAHKAIERHRMMRSGKGFVTIEKYTDIHEIEISDRSFVLIECIGNLLANEMFCEDGFCDPTDKIINGLSVISNKSENIVIVTNQVGSDGISYSKEISAYIAAMGKINSAVSDFSDSRLPGMGTLLHRQRRDGSGRIGKGSF